MISRAVEASSARAQRDAPLPCGTTASILEAATTSLGTMLDVAEGIGVEAALARIAHTLFTYGLDLSHPHATAHLQPPALAVAVAADALASASNASLDTFDSGPSGIAIERWLVATLIRIAKLGPNADGVLTPGGSMSNLLALLLARDAAAARLGVDARKHGVGAITRPAVFCSELAHFSVHRACAALGLGEASVRPIPVDAQCRMKPVALERELLALEGSHTPIAVVATAGTTDFGSVDPLAPITDIARRYGLWMHVDAAYGFGTLFSPKLRTLLAGIERADSITLDLHKIGWQPAAASVLLVADTQAFLALEREVPYLNPGDDAALGYDGLLGRSLQTTRRPDAVKVAATLLAYGERGLGDMVDACHALAVHAAQRITREPTLELVSNATMTTVVFRYRGRSRRARASIEDASFFDAVNGATRRRLIESGEALIGRTSAVTPTSEGHMRVCLKLTLLNPTTTADEIDALISAVLGAASQSEHDERLRTRRDVISHVEGSTP